MPRLIAFLRAINVGGHVVKMDELRRHFTAAGCADVETFIASGNVIFSSKAADIAKLNEQIEARLKKALGYEVKTFLRTDAEVAAVARYKPFPEARVRAAHALYVAFVAKPLGPAARKAVDGFKADLDDFHVHGREVYWLRKVSQVDSKFTNVRFEKRLEASATWRNVNTVVRLAAKYPPADAG